MNWIRSVLLTELVGFNCWGRGGGGNGEEGSCGRGGGGG